MPAVDYIWEKVSVAIDCLASGEGTFEERLADAYVSALDRLESKDPPAELAEDLNWVLLQCEHYHINGTNEMKQIPELERRKVVEKLISILVATSRMTRGAN